MTSNKTFITIFFFAAALAGFSFAMSGVPVLAHSKEAPTAFQRANFKKKIDHKLSNLKNSNQRKSRDYEKRIAGFEKQIKRLEEKGANVTKSRASLEVLRSKVLQAEQDYSAYLTTLEATKSFSSNQDPNLLLTTREQAQAQAKQIRADYTEIHNFIKQDLRPELEAARNQIKR